MMEASEITRRNEAIAKYMGWTLLQRNDDGNGDWWMTEEERSAMPDMSGVYHGELPFNSDWRALMPVVEKMLSQSSSIIGSMVGLVREQSGEFTVMLQGGNIGKEPTMIEAVFRAVSDYCLSLEPKI